MGKMYFAILLSETVQQAPSLLILNEVGSQGLAHFGEQLEHFSHVSKTA